jgi:hypothetical protein
VAAELGIADRAVRGAIDTIRARAKAGKIRHTFERVERGRFRVVTR